ncbi:TetR/AcrR family transcriptional regulator [Paucilactobacillus suebicus]|nr:TetR/AcrR family transcriptional regulator [Paucilactobacillus suebicus]
MDKRIVKTQRKLWTALFTILATKNIDDITVTELCSMADITRRTFYRTFSNVPAVFDSYSDYLNEQARQTLSAQYADVNELLSAFDRLVTENYTGLRLIFTDQRHLRLVDNFVDAFYQSLCQVVLNNQHNVHNRLVMKYVASGILGMMAEWFKSMPEVKYGELAKVVKPMVKSAMGMLT